MLYTTLYKNESLVIICLSISFIYKTYTRKRSFHPFSHVNFATVISLYKFVKTTDMKTLKIYNIIASVMIVLLVIWVKKLQKDISETGTLLEQCSARYYGELKKDGVF